jgi:hypothetical protein
LLKEPNTVNPMGMKVAHSWDYDSRPCNHTHDDDDDVTNVFVAGI